MTLETEIKTFNSKKGDLLNTARGKFVLIQGADVVDTYNKIEDAVSTGVRLYGLKPFLVRPILDKPEKVQVPAYTLGLISRANP